MLRSRPAVSPTAVAAAASPPVPQTVTAQTPAPSLSVLRAGEEAARKRQRQASLEAAPADHPHPQSGIWTEEMDLDAEVECAICLTGRMSDPCRTPCGHRFCSACLERALASERACPLCRSRVTPFSAVRERCNEPLRRPAVSSIWGTQFVQCGRLGLASYHFAADATRAWIAYDPAVVPADWRLDDGSALPPQKEFEQPRYDAEARTFMGTVRWAPSSLGGQARWEYRMVLDESMESISGGGVRAFDAAGALVDDMQFGQQLQYTRARSDMFGAVFVQLPSALSALSLSLSLSMGLQPRSRLLQRLVGRASYHFAREGSYISYEGSADVWRLDSGAPLPARKAFENAAFDVATRTFSASVDWSTTPLRGSVRWEYEMRFDALFQRVESGTVRSVFADGSEEVKRFGVDLKYVALDSPT